MFLHELPVTGGPAGMTAAIYAARVFRWPREETWNHDVNFALISLEIILRYFRYISWNHLTKEFRLLQFQEMWISRSGLDGWNAMRFAPSRNPSPICVHWSSHLRWVDSSWPKESGKPILGLGVWCCFFSIPFWCFFGIGEHGCLFCHTIAIAFEHTKFYIYVMWYILYTYNIHTYIHSQENVGWIVRLRWMWKTILGCLARMGVRCQKTSVETRFNVPRHPNTIWEVT